LGQIADASAPAALRPLLADSSRTVRVHAGISLALLGQPQGLPVCEAVLQADPPWVRYLAVHALWRLGTDAARNVLARYQAGQDPLVATAIAGALATPTPPLPPLPSVRDTSSDGLSTHEIWERAADAFTAEGDWWWHQGDYDQVIRCEEMAIFFDPTYAEDYAVIAWLQWSLGRDQAAIRTLKRGIAAAPANPEMYFNLGYHYFNTHRESLAVEPLRRAVELGGDPLCRRTYAHCLEHLGQLHEALAQWQDILRLDPTDAIARANRDRVQALLAQGSTP
jgi:tetratricopeptide (TPR) repeat protein